MLQYDRTDLYRDYRKNIRKSNINPEKKERDLITYFLSLVLLLITIWAILK